MSNPTAKGQLPNRNKNKQMSKLLGKARDYYKISTDQYEDTIAEGHETIDMYHNRQYTQAQINTLRANGQPVETFNVIKMFTNAMIGYLETIVTKATAEPRYPGSAVTSLLMNDVLQYVLEDNDWSTAEKFVKIDGLLTGLMVVHEEPRKTGETDMFGRDIHEIKLNHIPSWQVRLDPQSHKEDYSDARFIHHFKWLPEETVKKLWPHKVAALNEYYNYLEDPESEYYRSQNNRDVGKYKDYNNYLITKTVLYDNNKVWSIIWHDEVQLEKKEITFKKARFPFRVTKMSKSDRAEYYGPFREVVETQKAINQALLQIQLLINTSKAFVEDGAVENIEEFREMFGRVNAVIPILNMQGIKIEDMSRDIASQYTIIDQALSRIKMVLGINDSFLGSAYASDSGRKVQIQKMSSASQLTNIVDRVSGMFKFVGQDIVDLASQYYRGNQILRIADPLNSYHFTEINAPLMMPVMDPNGQPVIDPTTQQPVTQPVIVPDEDPETGEVMKDDNGNIIMIPLNDPSSDIEFSDTDIVMVSSKGDNSDEKNQLLFETFTNGPMGSILMNMNPSGTLRIMAMQISEYGTKHSIEIAQILMETAMMVDQGQIDPMKAMQGLGADVQKMMGASMGGQTGNVQNMPQSNSGQQPGNAGGIPQVGNEGGRP